MSDYRDLLVMVLVLRHLTGNGVHRDRAHIDGCEINIRVKNVLLDVWLDLYVAAHYV